MHVSICVTSFNSSVISNEHISFVIKEHNFHTSDILDKTSGGTVGLYLNQAVALAIPFFLPSYLSLIKM